MPSILLVEDDEQLRDSLKLMLTTLGYEVWATSNGKNVGAMYEQRQPDLVITDLLMPEKDGLEVIMDLRRRDQKLRIIAMSEPEPKHYLQLAMTLGAQRTLAKPFSNEEFSEAVRLLLERDA